MIAWRRWSHAFLVGGSLLGVTLLVLAPLLSEGKWPITHEWVRYGLLLGHFQSALSHGFAYPRWMPELFGGYGYPTFVFYQPGFFYLATAFAALPGSPWVDLVGAVFVLFLTGGLGAYMLGRELGGRGLGLFCAILFLLTPYIYVNLYVRGDLSELAAMMLVPWPFYGLARLERQVRDGAPVAPWVRRIALVLALVVVTHPLVAFFLLPAFCLIALGAASGLDGRMRFVHLKSVGMAVAVGVALSAPYWLPVLQMKSLVNLEAASAGVLQPHFHVVYPNQFFSSVWGYGFSLPGPENDSMSFQLGLPHFALAALGAWLAGDRRLIRGAFLACLGFMLLMSPIATPAWETLSLLQPVQFPWRILAITATLQIIACAGLVGLTVQRLPNRNFLLATLLLATALWNSNQFQPTDTLNLNQIARNHHRNPMASMDTMALANEFLPKTANPDAFPSPRGRSTVVSLDGPGTAEPLPDHNAHRIHYRVRSDVATTATIQQLYLPGWIVRVDGRLLSSKTLEDWLRPDGRMRFPVPAGVMHVVEAHYGGPPGWPLRAGLFAAGVLILVVVTMRERSRNRARLGSDCIDRADDHRPLAPRRLGSAQGGRLVMACRDRFMSFRQIR